MNRADQGQVHIDIIRGIEVIKGKLIMKLIQMLNLFPNQQYSKKLKNNYQEGQNKKDKNKLI